VLLRGFLAESRDVRALAADDGELIERVQRELAPLLGLTAAPVLARVYRWPHATPQMEVGHLGRVAAIERRLASLPGLVLIGAGLRATGIPDTIADARRMTAAALSEAA